MKNKSDVFNIFAQFITIVEKHLNLPTLTFFSDNGREFVKLKHFLATHDIFHLTTLPHTPEINGTTERRHCHIVETDRAVLHHAKLPCQFWSFAFNIATYLINRMPTPILHMKSHYEVVFDKPPDYNRLHAFGCLCFPWLRPYTKHKLQNRSSPCIFLGYSLSQYAFYCLEPISGRIYTSRHVKFIENQFPYSNLASSTTPSTSIPPIDPTLHTIIPSYIQTQPVQQVSHPTTNFTHNDLASIVVPAPELPLA
jgi:hypothetical protein